MKKRLYFIDLLRGIAIINMVVYHLLYDIVYIFGGNGLGFTMESTIIWERMIAISFILISGFSYHLGHNHNKQIITILTMAFLITAITVVMIPQEQILFGILHFIGFGTLILFAIEKQLKKITPIIGMIISVILFIASYNIAQGIISFGGMSLEIPKVVYDTSFLFPLGFPGIGFSSSDYFPIFPWIFLLMVGYFAGSAYKQNRLIIPDIGSKNNPLVIMGQKSLLIYMLHQPVIMAILWLIYKI